VLSRDRDVRWQKQDFIPRPVVTAASCARRMLLQALVACAGVTLRAVATSLEMR